MLSSIVIADTNVLINFLHIERLDLLASLSYHFMVTNHVQEEITAYYTKQRILLHQAIEKGVIEERGLTTSRELSLFGKLLKEGRVGTGESSAIACAISGQHYLAIDDKRAIREAKKLAPSLSILRTQDLVTAMIDEKLLDIQQADTIKNRWQYHHKFHLKIDSFKELMNVE